MKPNPGHPGHRQTDPACYWYYPPRGPISRWWNDWNRGKACKECMDIRARSALIITAAIRHLRKGRQ